MWRIKLKAAEYGAIRTSLAVGMVFSFYAATIGGGIGPASVTESLSFGIVYSFVVFATVMIGGRHAWQLLWALLSVLWAAFVYDSFSAEAWNIREGAKLIITPFVSWSLLGVPLAVGTVLFLRILHPRDKVFSVMSGVWLCLLTLVGYFGSFAPDVGPPRYGSETTVALGVMSIFLPALTAAYCIYHTSFDQPT